jgi:hypothetical protein
MMQKSKNDILKEIFEKIFLDLPNKNWTKNAPRSIKNSDSTEFKQKFS